MSEAYPHWQRAARRRLQASVALSALAIAVLIWAVEFPRDAARPPAIELRLLEEPAVDRTEQVEPMPVETEEALPAEAMAADEPTTEPIEPPDPADRMPEAIDWYGQIEAAVVSALDEAAATVSVNPGFDRKRREAAARFAPSRAPKSVPIWENVETDQLGRKVLVSGSCYRVIDDPSAVNYEVFRTFHQYLVHCASYRRPARALPWVAELRDRYDYLADDDAGLGAPRSELSARLDDEGPGSAGFR